MEPNVAYSNQQSLSTSNQVARMQGVPYSKGIGSVLWPAVVSRPDIAYTVGILLQFIKTLGQSHWEALKRVIMYLRTERGPHYRGRTIPFIWGRGRWTPSISTHHANSLTYPCYPHGPLCRHGVPTSTLYPQILDTDGGQLCHLSFEGLTWPWDNWDRTQEVSSLKTGQWRPSTPPLPTQPADSTTALWREPTTPISL